MCILLFKILIVGIYLVINVIPILLCFSTVILNVCLIGLVKNLFCSIVRVGIRNSWIFPKLVKLDPCAVASLLEVFKGNNFGCKVCILFQVGTFIIFDCASEFFLKQNNFEVW